MTNLLLQLNYLTLYFKSAYALCPKYVSIFVRLSSTTSNLVFLIREIFGEYLEKYSETDFDLKEDSIARRFTESKYDCSIKRQMAVSFNKPR